MTRRYIFRAIDIILIASVVSQLFWFISIPALGHLPVKLALLGLILMFGIGAAGEGLDRAGYFSRGKHHDER